MNPRRPLKTKQPKNISTGIQFEGKRFVNVSLGRPPHSQTRQAQGMACSRESGCSGANKSPTYRNTGKKSTFLANVVINLPSLSHPWTDERAPKGHALCTDTQTSRKVHRTEKALADHACTCLPCSFENNCSCPRMGFFNGYASEGCFDISLP